MHIRRCFAQVTERRRLKASNQLNPRQPGKLEFAAIGVFRVTERAETIELVCPSRINAAGPADVTGRIGPWCKAGIMKVIVRKQGTIVALGAIAFANEKAKPADFFIRE